MSSPYCVSSRKELLIVRTVSLEAFKFCCAYMMYLLLIMYREGGNGVMEQTWTIHTGRLVSQIRALAITA
jgi:hypothetical protein